MTDPHIAPTLIMYPNSLKEGCLLKKILALGLAAIIVLIMAPSASAWTPEDCAKVHWDHPDCANIPRPQATVCLNGTTQQVPADEVPEGATPGECEEAPVVPPEQPPVTPPEQPTVPPTTPPVATVPETPAPPEVLPKIEDEAPQPQADIGKPGEVVAGEEQVNNNVPTEDVVTAQPEETLPYTGTPILLIALVGAAGGLLGFGLMHLTRPKSMR